MCYPIFCVFFLETKLTKKNSKKNPHCNWIVVFNLSDGKKAKKLLLCTVYDWWEALHLHRWRWGGESVTREFMNIFPLLFCCVWVLYQVLYLRCVQMRSDSFAGQFLLIVWLCYIQYLSGFFSLSPSVVDIMHKTYPLQYSLWHISFFGQEIFDERNDPAGCFHHSCLVSFEILSLFLIICKQNQLYPNNKNDQ